MKQVVQYEEFLTSTRRVAKALREEVKPDLVLSIPRGGMSFAHVLSLELGVACHELDLEFGPEYISWLETKLVGVSSVVVADDSIGTGATFRVVQDFMCSRLIPWVYAVYYIDSGNDLVKSSVYRAQDADKWVVLPWEHCHLIEVNDRSSLFRNGTDPYQRRSS